ncbi:hypothetical protein HPP92_000073 [Vanilla planifolia]|uniref:C2H2-type domain-containing protein n=1 Tax=Vanilla planifolia TaxID=51239 RepID=A0A835RXA4_VANPL|nr:hypothetical protein HPP92_000073 [Vanilla planifolia]
MAGASRAREQNKRSHKDRKEASKEEESPTPRNALTSFFTRRHHQAAAVEEGQQKKCKRIGCSGSLCKLKENPKVSQRPETATSSKSYNKRSSMSVSSRSIKAPLRDMNGVQRRGSLRAIHLGRLSGCYECQMVVDPINGVFRNTSLRSTLCSCQDCGESFLKAESLELHKALRHAELDPEDSSRNIVKIIFQSSWLKKQPPACTIDRLLKIHNSDKTRSFRELP